MPITIPNIVIQPGTITNIYANQDVIDAGIAIGQKVSVRMLGAGFARWYSGETPPATIDNSTGFRDISSDEVIENEDGNKGLYIYSRLGCTINVGSPELPSGLFSGFRAINTQSYTESNVKLGLQFGLTVEIEIAPGATANYTLKTPADKNVSIKTRLISTNGGMRYQPRAGAVLVNDGPAITPNNLNGQSSNVSLVEVRGEPSIITDPGVSFDVVRSAEGSGNQDEQGIFTGDGIERVLDKDTLYLLEFENLDNKAVWVVYSVTWYEGRLDLPLS